MKSVDHLRKIAVGNVKEPQNAGKMVSVEFKGTDNGARWRGGEVNVDRE